MDIHSQNEKRWRTSVHVNAFRFVGFGVLHVAKPDEKRPYDSDRKSFPGLESLV